MLAGVQAMNALRSAVLQRLLRLLKEMETELARIEKRLLEGDGQIWLATAEKQPYQRWVTETIRVLAWEWGTTSNCLWSVPPPVPLVHCTVLLDGGRPF